ncbi:MAG: hypothetical protein AVDCRST_MAG56-6431 [uncultured Cytophagales bacterium]|uniref:TolB protein, periplasmic protein involved in the tonb-independent uptake of group A colicins n=1 Tax=uncultured Cytophagales bacterium TaxID=158755 RepID=A0A6J4KRN1_9SPHI|nr:MAG: hypothetical protein AVDCRST_MAG56-6431 [uncultured Cytophagales bacterium]
MRNLALLAGLLAFLPAFRAFCQTQPILDQNPARIKWFQVSTPRFRVIFPEGFDREALRTANTLQHIYTPVSRTLGREPRPISIVLQNQTAVSNGFVTLTPRRSEFFTTPPQDFTLLGNNDWLDLLAVHEFRHVVQYDKALTGFSRGLYYLFGNNGLSLVSTTVPSWFWEGDAVGTETALTGGGRGRIPAFDVALRTQLLTRGPFSYSKAYLRSYKDFVPNHYVLGYFMTTYLKRHYGAEAWGRILTRTYNVPFQPFRFSWAIRKETGMKVETLYRQTVRELDSLWTGQGTGLPEKSAVTALPTDRNKVFTNYEYPQYLSDGRILAQKSGLAHIDQFVTLGREGGEQKVYVPGFLSESVTLSVAADRLVWTERAFDPRWGLRDYSVMKVYDLRTRQKRQISRQTRLGAPAFSPDGKQIVAVRVLPSNAYNLVLLDGETGRELKTFENPENAFYTAPRFTPDGGAVVVVKRIREGKTIERINVQTGERRDLVPYTGLNLSNPVAHGDYVYFNSPRNGIDNIFAVHVPTGRQYQVTDRQFGAYNATLSPDGREMAFQDFTPAGFRIATQPVDTAAWTPLENVTDRTVAYYQPLIAQEGGHSILDDVPRAKLPVRRYRQWKQLFNPYSWGPLVSSSGEALEVSLASQDLLSTTLANVGYGYDANQNTGRFFANLSYQGWYPVLDATFSSGMRQTAVTINNVRQDPDTTFRDAWRENRFSAGVRLPFNFTRSKYSESLSLGAFVNVTDVSGYGLPVRFYSETGNGTLYDTRYSLTYNRLIKTAPRDVLPRWGQSLSLYFRHTPFRGDYSGRIFTAQAGLLLPGLGRHHGLWLRGGYQQEDLRRTARNYRFPTTLLFPRGFLYQSFEHFVKGSADYRLPILYPDLAFWRLAYLQRIKGNLFFDAGQGVAEGRTRNFYSLGLDLTADFNVLRLLPQLEVGFRTYYLPQTGKVGFEFLVLDIGF